MPAGVLARALGLGEFDAGPEPLVRPSRLKLLRHETFFSYTYMGACGVDNVLARLGAWLECAVARPRSKGGGKLSWQHNQAMHPCDPCLQGHARPPAAACAACMRVRPTFQSLTVLSLVDSSIRVLLELRHHLTLLIFSSISSDLR